MRASPPTQPELPELLDAARSPQPVSGLTHNFYRYPARFSPLVARAAIRAFTRPGETVFDPFMGGGTALVEAAVLGRRAIGTDISALATFIARVKTTALKASERDRLSAWAATLPERLKLNRPPAPANSWRELGYQRNISTRHTWAIRKTLELTLHSLAELPERRLRDFARCATLRTGQWALDCRNRIPSASDFRRQLVANVRSMLAGAARFSATVRSAGAPPPVCIQRSAVGVEHDARVCAFGRPKLVLTSPPYPGVHVLYHRWQVQGRSETPAPFWIAGCVDGQGESYYTLGSRKSKSLDEYCDRALAAFRSVSRIAGDDTILVQVIGFSDPSCQLPAYLKVMQEAGWEEERFPAPLAVRDGRLWRSVPNRKWYASHRGTTGSGTEVVLLHGRG